MSAPAQIRVTIIRTGPAAVSADILRGPAGIGFLAGGTTGQVLKKKSGSNYDTEWAADIGSSPTTHATLTIGTGDAAVPFEAKEADSAGAEVSVAYASAAASPTTEVSLIGSAFTVTPGSKAAMVVSGTTSPDFNGTLEYYAEVNGEAAYTAQGANPYALTYNGPMLSQNIGNVEYDLIMVVNGAGITPHWKGTVRNHDWPDDVDDWESAGGATGTLIVESGNSTSRQVATAVNSQQDAAATKIVVASFGGTGLGSVTAPVTAANLSLT